MPVTEIERSEAEKRLRGAEESIRGGRRPVEEDWCWAVHRRGAMLEAIDGPQQPNASNFRAPGRASSATPGPAVAFGARR